MVNHSPSPQRQRLHHEMNLFSSTQPILPSPLDVQVTVKPAKAVFFAGELFSAVITLSIAPSTSLPPSPPVSAIRKPPITADRSTLIPPLPLRRGRIGQHKHHRPDLAQQQPYSPGASTLHRACPSLPSVLPRQIGHGRRTQSLALGAVSPQEMVWALTTAPLPPRKSHGRSSSSTIRPPVYPTTTTITWAYTHLSGMFHPSAAHIPPDPLLPLRSLLLHRPVGSGTLQASTSKWQLSFGTGSIGMSTQPTLTGSLFGLAKDLVGGSSGTLEEERKRVWNMKDLPVLETSRHLLGVDIQLERDEPKDFTYSISLPDVLPPTYKGKAYRFSYNLIISVGSKEFSIPIKIVPRPQSSPYDILKPNMTLKEEDVNAPSSLQTYCRDLLAHKGQEDPNDVTPAQAVEYFTRQSSSAAFDIAQDGKALCTITLVKSIFRVGETVIGVIDLAKSVARTGIFLEAHEIIPSILHPPAQPPRPITRVYAEYAQGYCEHTSKMTFSLDVPSDATPGFGLAAGDGRIGGLEWRIRFAFLVPKRDALVAKGRDPDNRYYAVRKEFSTSVVDCEIPIQVLAGNIAYLVEPTVQQI